MSARERFLEFLGNIPSVLEDSCSRVLHAVPWILLGVAVYVVIGFLAVVLINYLEKKAKNDSYLHMPKDSGVVILFWPFLLCVAIVCSPAAVLDWFLKRKGVPMPKKVRKTKKEATKNESNPIYRQEVLNRFVEKSKSAGT